MSAALADAFAPLTCGWCLASLATTTRYTVPTCSDCDEATARERATRWMRAVHARNQGASK